MPFRTRHEDGEPRTFQPLLTTLGFQPNGVRGEETAAQKTKHLGLMFGACKYTNSTGSPPLVMEVVGKLRSLPGVAFGRTMWALKITGLIVLRDLLAAIWPFSG